MNPAEYVKSSYTFKEIYELQKLAAWYRLQRDHSQI